MDFQAYRNAPRRGGVGAMGAAVVLSALAMGIVPAREARAQETLPTDVVYVESNNIGPNANSILAYKRDAQGALTPLPGSPFPTRGAGVFDPSLSLGPFDADQDIIVDKSRRLLFAVNSGSNTIAVFRLKSDGTLVHVPGSPFPSGGVMPISLGLGGAAHNILVVINKNEDPAQLPNNSLPNYTTFSVARSGSLSPIPNSTIRIPQGSSPTQALISPSGGQVFDANFAPSDPALSVLRSFRLRPEGRLRQNPPLPFDASAFTGPTANAPRIAFGLWTHPVEKILYSTYTTVGKIGVYTYDNDARLTFVRTVPNSGAAGCWLRVNRAGTRLYASNTVSHTITVFDLTDPLNPVEIQSVTLKGPGETFDITFDADEEFFYVVRERSTNTIPDTQGNALSILKVDDDGLLSEVPSSPLALPTPAGIRSKGLVAL